MPSEIEKRDFALSTIKPMANHTLPYLTQVVGVIDEKTGEHRGTGFFCQIDGRQAIVTAGHVLRQAAKEGIFQSLAFTRGSGERPTIVPGKIHYSDELDLAIYLPSDNFPLGNQKAFWPEDRIEKEIERLSSDYLFVQGFPGRFALSRTETTGPMVSKTLAYGAMMRSRDQNLGDEEPLPDTFLKSHQFAMNFSVEPGSLTNENWDVGDERSSAIQDWSSLFFSGSTNNTETSRPTGPSGLSGSPIWRIGAAGKPIRDWTPDASQLVGIVTDWSESRKILIATFASKLFEFLSRREIRSAP